MAEIKSGEADRFVDRPDPAIVTFLLYGPDTGLVGERADRLAANAGVDLSDPFSLIRLDADLAAADPGRLSDEANTISMFGGKRLIRISGVTRRNLAAALKPVIDAPPSDCRIIVEAGDLKRDSALRRMAEKGASSAAIPCYPDDARALDALIRSVLESEGLRIDRDALTLLRSSLGGDRRASRSEIAKLALYCSGRESVTSADVAAIVSDVSAPELDALIDAAATGDIATVDSLVSRLEETGISPDMAMVFCLRHFQQLHALRSRMDAGRIAAGDVIGQTRPPLHFSRKAAFTTALSVWSAERLERILARLEKATLDCRARPGIAAALASSTFLALATMARAASRR
jgi:DNA polymerase-3 subunit delta